MINIDGDVLGWIIGFFSDFFQSEGYVKGGLIILGVLFVVSFALRKIKFLIFFLFIMFLVYLEYHYGFAREIMKLLGNEVNKMATGM